MSPRSLSHRGLTTVLFALCLTVILGVAALAIDAGVLFEQRRRAQAAADATALAAATELFYQYPYDHGLDSFGTAKATAIATATANGFNCDDGDVEVTVNIPPETGCYVGESGYAEVTVQYMQSRGFSSIFGGERIPVTARAVAEGKWTDVDHGIIVLHPTMKGALTVTGRADMIVVGAGVVVDSNHSEGARSVGGGDAWAPYFNVSGVPGMVEAGGGEFYGPVTSGVPPTPDPLRYLPEPDPNSLPIANGGQPVSYSNLPPGGVTLYPGVYKGGIKITANGPDEVRLMPGIYYMDGGGFQSTGSAPLIGHEVLLFNAPILSSDVITLTSDAKLELTPMTSGPYKGLTIFQDRESTNTVTLAGQGKMNIIGSVYVAHGLLKVTGTGASNNIGSQYIVYELAMDGKGNINVGWTPEDTVRVRLVRLVE